MKAKTKKELQENIQKLIAEGTIDKFLQHEPGTENGCIEGTNCTDCNDIECEHHTPKSREKVKRKVATKRTRVEQQARNRFTITIMRRERKIKELEEKLKEEKTLLKHLKLEFKKLKQEEADGN